MNSEYVDEDLVIDFSKPIKILLYRKNLFIKVFSVCLLFFVLLTFVTPKLYKTDADIYIDKSGNTNLAEVNPYLISYLTGVGGNGLSSFLTGSNMELQNELEILQSPLVMDNVIRENNLRYAKGKKKGEFLSTRDFLKGTLNIENKKGTNVISIKYKSKDPKLSYNVVNSIIANYEKVHEDINTKKTVSDKKLLEASYENTNTRLNKKLNAMKHSSAMPDTAMSGLGMLAALRGHSKAISGAVGSIQGQVVEGQKAQISVDQDVEKLKLVKTKLEWTKLVEQMSKGTTNVIVLKAPEIKRSFEQSSPKLWINLLLGTIVGLFAALFAASFAEQQDNKLTYSELDNKIIDSNKEDIDELKLALLANVKENLLIIYFDGADLDCFKNLKNFANFRMVKAEINQNTINEIQSSNKLMFMAKIGSTPKKLYKQFKQVCSELNKPVLVEIV